MRDDIKRGHGHMMLHKDIARTALGRDIAQAQLKPPNKRREDRIVIFPVFAKEANRFYEQRIDDLRTASREEWALSVDSKPADQ
jgi:hypothetical protein